MKKKETIYAENSIWVLSLKVFGSSLLGTAFCLLTQIFIAFLYGEGLWGAIVLQLFCLVLYCPIVYMTAWSLGAKDRNYVLYGHMKEDKLRGAKIGLVAIIPYIICALFLVLAKARVFPDFLVLFRFIYSPFAVLLRVFLPDYLSDVTYCGILFSALTQLVCPITTGIGYWLGYHEISLYQKLIYQKK